MMLDVLSMNNALSKIAQLERELAECKDNLHKVSLDWQKIHMENQALAAQVVQMKSALTWYVEEDDVIESMDGNEFWVEGKRSAEAALALDTKPAEQIVKCIEARALRKAAESFGYGYSFELRRMADELEKSLNC